MNEYRPGLLYDKTTITGEKNMTDGDINTSDLITNEGLIFILDKVTFVEKVFMAESHPWRTKVEFYRDIELNELITYIDPSNANMSITGAFYNVHADKVKAIKILSVSADFTRNITMFDIYGVQEVLDKYLFQDGEEIKKYIDIIGDYIPVIPTMSSNNSPDEYVVKSIQGVQTSSYAYKIFDNDSETSPGYSGGNGVIAISLPEEKRIRSTEISNIGIDNAPDSYILEGSNDEVNWDILFENHELTWNQLEVKKFNFFNDNFYKYYKFTVSRIRTPYTRVASIQIYENKTIKTWQTIGTAPATKEMFDTHGMTDLSIIDNEAIQGLVSDTPELLCWTDDSMTVSEADIIPKMGPSNINEDCTVSASSFSGSGESFGPWRAFDDKNDSTEAWLSNNENAGAWLKVEFTDPKIIRKYVIESRRDTWGGRGAPNSWSFEGSHDNEEWVVLDTQVGHDDWGNFVTRKEFNISNSVFYKYYRILVLSTNGSSAAIGEMELYELSQVSRKVNLTAIPHPQLLLPKENIEVGDIESVKLESTVSDQGVLKIIASGDSGSNWHGLSEVIGYGNLSNLPLVKDIGFTLEEFNVLTKDELSAIFPNGRARFAFYLEQESLTDVVEINSLTINEKQYTMTPSVESLSVMYELLEADKPTLYVSRDDGETWTQVKDDKLTDISSQPEGNKLRVKAVLENGQEIHGLSYAWI
ncbi:discoidin domain-containing protein [Oceanobacillus profundus]|uniref:F5/8 type C domain-containing protein n=1 Tax=Oceanobacillus profundus TaxID=372463 RepID=A0A417YGQ8_9BACI|nr:discoidin domain-containing protein [Oceanobacillus profundus]RHW32010.1 hypothetical protein D1B32_12300 [Oceanobacillus profundus]